MKIDHCFYALFQGAQSLRFLQLRPKVRHQAVVVVVPQQLQDFLDDVIWLSPEKLKVSAQLILET